MTGFNVGLAQQEVSAAVGTGPHHGPQAAHTAQGLYHRAYQLGWLRRGWAVLTGQSWALLNLSAVTATTTIVNRHAAGIRSVPIRQIQGSEGRCTDFDNAFHPLQQHNQQRWVSVATAWLRGVPLPPVELIRLGEVYFVQDGHHRISVARALGQQDIDGVVTVWQGTAPWPWECPADTPSLRPGMAFRWRQLLRTAFNGRKPQLG